MAFAELTWPHRRLDPKDALRIGDAELHSIHRQRDVTVPCVSSRMHVRWYIRRSRGASLLRRRHDDRHRRTHGSWLPPASPPAFAERVVLRCMAILSRCGYVTKQSRSADAERFQGCRKEPWSFHGFCGAHMAASAIGSQPQRAAYAGSSGCGSRDDDALLRSADRDHRRADRNDASLR